MTQRKIGLTGGIGTGKTTVSNYLAKTYKLPILDADIYARQAVEINSPILNKIAQRYGTEILLSDGSLNRQKLGEVVFHNNEERIWLEQQIHPFVRQRFAEEMNKLPSNSTVILVIPLLFEAKLTNLVTEIWVVFVDEQQQITRLMQRNNLTIEQAKARINSQMPLVEKCQKADVILDNSDSLESLYKQIDAALTS
ncbi:dephospho-CoA kinase [[Phormidium ambiguum] IAM M-71]|uniref:Dephospho-CoA kinase n=1 Tax=[Phormidium ambiguum] IAM M-71 TaxID=454136 RepID=A0A1U7I6Q6_9CYAN|nr:dephospho-CoA kinase [Phormidium ambiguum]OKH32032.1 dephospho-CoA kinase [Phormidium ambiguum IAM M-71]